jgi:DNA-binding NarL/FixJ family response regulator
MTKIRVLLADDHPVVRTGIRVLLEKAYDIKVVAEAATGAEVLPLIERATPDILVLDMEMPELSGVQVAQKLKAAGSPVRVLALSAYDDAQYVHNLLANGAAGYLTKEEAPEMIVDAVRGIARGEEGWISRRAAAKVTAWTREGELDTHGITDRELEVLRLVAAGKTNQEIGLALGISEKTVEKHMASLFTKLDAVSRVEVAVWAVQQGLE